MDRDLVTGDASGALPIVDLIEVDPIEVDPIEVDPIELGFLGL
ncbi:hypothetical protein [Lyngbya confervoides]|nr:hypothetical protein [Lyngbya confervoides]